MSTADTARVIREIAGKRARDEAFMLDRLVAELRLASFRSYLAATVVSMTALVPEILASAGSDVSSAMQRLRPSHVWPSVTARAAEYGQTGPKTDRMVKVGKRLFKRPAPLIGDAVITEGVFGPCVEAKVVGGSLDIVLRCNGFKLSTADGDGYLEFDAELPPSVLAVCPGRPLADVVDHPLLKDRGIIISDAAQVGGSSSLSFKVGRMPLDVPWRP